MSCDHEVYARDLGNQIGVQALGYRKCRKCGWCIAHSAFCRWHRWDNARGWIASAIARARVLFGGKDTGAVREADLSRKHYL